MRAMWCLLCLVSCGSRSPLPGSKAEDESSKQLDGPDEDTPSGQSASSTGPPPPPPDCFGTGETLLATEEMAPTSIAIDDSYVYWASAGDECGDGRIRSTSKAGGPIVTLADAQPNPRAVAVDAERVYFLDGCGSGLLRSVPKQGGSVVDHPIVVDVPFHDARVLALDSRNIYFNDYGVLSVPKRGGAQMVIDNADYVYALAADDGGVHWIGPIGGGPQFGVWAFRSGDPGPTLLAQPDLVGSGIAIDRDDVYFAGGIGIQRISRKGGQPSLLIAAAPWKIALDDGFVYWTEGVLGSGGHAIKKVAKTGGNESTLATGDGAYVDLAVDDGCVYWADLYGHHIGRVPK